MKTILGKIIVSFCLVKIHFQMIKKVLTLFIVRAAPFKTYKDIDNVLTKLIKTKADSVIGVVKLDDMHPIRIKKIEY